MKVCECQQSSFRSQTTHLSQYRRVIETVCYYRTIKIDVIAKYGCKTNFKVIPVKIEENEKDIMAKMPF